MFKLKGLQFKELYSQPEAKLSIAWHFQPDLSAEFYNYYWLPFIPLVVRTMVCHVTLFCDERIRSRKPMSCCLDYTLLLQIVLAVSTKLQVIITQMCVQSCSTNSVTRGTCLVKPHDDLFWFGQPNCLLLLIQFIMIQVCIAIVVPLSSLDRKK